MRKAESAKLVSASSLLREEKRKKLFHKYRLALLFSRHLHITCGNPGPHRMTCLRCVVNFGIRRIIRATCKTLWFLKRVLLLGDMLWSIADYLRVCRDADHLEYVADQKRCFLWNGCPRKATAEQSAVMSVPPKTVSVEPSNGDSSDEWESMAAQAVIQKYGK